MDWKFVLALVFALIVAIFALQNAGAVDISFLNLELSISQALVILISAFFGALVVLMLSLVRWIRHQSKLKNLTKTVNSLETENKQLKMKLDDFTKKIDVLEQQSTPPSEPEPQEVQF